MISLATAKKATQDMLQAGVIETMEKTSGVLARLPFVEVIGSGYSYNIMEDLPEVGYRAVNTGYTSNAIELKQHVEQLVILGADADVDVYMVRTHSNVNDLRALQTSAKAKAVARKFEQDFFVGTGASNSLKGLDQRIEDSVAGVKIKKALSLDALNEVVDTVVDGASALFMGKKMRREVMRLLQENNHYIESGTDEFGRMVTKYNGIDIVAVDDVLIPEGKIYAIHFGEDQYVHGLSNGGIVVRDLGELDTLPVLRTRIEFYCGLATKHARSFVVLDTNVESKASKSK